MCFACTLLIVLHAYCCQAKLYIVCNLTMEFLGVSSARAARPKNTIVRLNMLYLHLLLFLSTLLVVLYVSSFVLLIFKSGGSIFGSMSVKFWPPKILPLDLKTKRMLLSLPCVLSWWIWCNYFWSACQQKIRHSTRLKHRT